MPLSAMCQTTFPLLAPHSCWDDRLLFVLPSAFFFFFFFYIFKCLIYCPFLLLYLLIFTSTFSTFEMLMLDLTCFTTVFVPVLYDIVLQ